MRNIIALALLMIIVFSCEKEYEFNTHSFIDIKLNDISYHSDTIQPFWSKHPDFTRVGGYFYLDSAESGRMDFWIYLKHNATDYIGDSLKTETFNKIFKIGSYSFYQEEVQYEPVVIITLNTSNQTLFNSNYYKIDKWDSTSYTGNHFNIKNLEIENSSGYLGGVERRYYHRIIRVNGSFNGYLYSDPRYGSQDSIKFVCRDFVATIYSF